jgi:hypothetical protein
VSLCLEQRAIALAKEALARDLQAIQASEAGEQQCQVITDNAQCFLGSVQKRGGSLLCFCGSNFVYVVTYFPLVVLDQIIMHAAVHIPFHLPTLLLHSPLFGFVAVIFVICAVAGH